jgi:predicted Zn-dependent peptidase
MIEHMCFQGTSHKINSKDVFLEYDKIGAYLNAFTEKEYTAFKVNCDILYLEKCIDVLSDIMIHSKFDKTKFYKEQKVVVEENLIRENDANHNLTERMDEILYKGNSFSYPIDTLRYHPTKNILKYELLEEWYQSFYVPSNMIFSIVSPYSFSKIISILEKTEFTKNNKNKTNQNKPFIKSLEYIPETSLPSPILTNTFLLEPTYSIIVKK